MTAPKQDGSANGYVAGAYRAFHIGMNPYRGSIRRNNRSVWTCEHSGHSLALALACARDELRAWGVEVPESEPQRESEREPARTQTHTCGECGREYGGRPHPVGGAGMEHRDLCVECFVLPRMPPMPPLASVPGTTWLPPRVARIG